MKHTIYLFLLALALVACNKTTIVTSPDRNTELTFSLTEDGAPQYTVNKNNQPVLLPSPLGFKIEHPTPLEAEEIIDLGKDFRILSTEQNSHNETWETVWGEEQYIVDHHNQLTVHLEHTSGIRLDVVFRVFNDGFAFRYVFPEQENLKDFTILDELSGFRFAEDPQAWSLPWRTEYYEGLWHKDALSAKTDTLCAPLTLEPLSNSPQGERDHAAWRWYGFLHEANITDYPAANFYYRDGIERIYLTPWRNAEGDMEVKAYLSAPAVTPWRMLILTETLPELMASRIMLNLNEPLAIADAREWIKPMKFIGIWWGMHLRKWTWRIGPIHGATTENMKQYLDFAADHNIQAVLAEGWNTGWEGYEGINNDRFSFVTPYADYDIDYLSDYAHSRGVEIVFHHETSGRADEYEADLDTAFQYMQAHGMHAVKTGYVSPIIRTTDGYQWNKGQSGVRHYRKVIETAARYHVAIDNHEPVMPNGLQRTYPNLMTQEGIRGQEWNAWSADGGSPCEHVTVLPFTRFMAGPADYTPGVFHFENPIIPGTRVHSTLMNQLALFVCFYSPLQMACDLPESYMEHPDAFRFIEDVPCDWKQSKLLDGRIGDYMVMARQDRNSDNWFVGGITDEEAREVTVCFDFLDPDKTYALTLYRDGDDAQWESNPYAYEIEHREVRSTDTLTLRMAEGGGFAISLTTD